MVRASHRSSECCRLWRNSMVRASHRSSECYRLWRNSMIRASHRSSECYRLCMHISNLHSWSQFIVAQWPVRASHWSSGVTSVSLVHVTQDNLNVFYFLKGFKQRNAYIATENPLNNTFEDFWQMIYEQNCPLIIMLSDWKEKHVVCQENI